MKFIDTHTHLFDTQFENDIDEVISRARSCGIKWLLMPAIDSSTHQAMIALSEKYSECVPMIGLHPTSIGEEDPKTELDIVERYMKEYRFAAIGEIGLDLYWSQEFLSKQVECLNAQIELALRYDLPLALHTRDAFPLMREMLARFKGRGLRGVLHSFSGSYEDFCEINKSGDFMAGIGGPCTYKKSVLPEVIEKIPLDRIVLETDSPYLPPVPYRGKRNESAYLPLIAEKIAEIKSMTVEKIAEATYNNSVKMFGLEDYSPHLK